MASDASRQNVPVPCVPNAARQPAQDEAAGIPGLRQDVGGNAVNLGKVLDSERPSLAAESDMHSAANSVAASDSTAATARTVPDFGSAQQVVKNFVRTYVKG